LKRALLLPVLIAAGVAWAGETCHTTSPYEQMQAREIELKLPAGNTRRQQAKIADDPVERAAGFQHVCAQDYARFPILFLFEAPVHTAFHMHNVHGPLDIAFLDGEGRVLEVQRMSPYASGAAPVYYRPARPFSAALEAEAGRLSELRPTHIRLSGN
jgi:uncharacterized membrane protein (UPF0127 family)